MAYQEIFKYANAEEEVISVHYQDLNDTISISITDGYGKHTNTITLSMKKAKSLAAHLENYIINLEEKEVSEVSTDRKGKQ